MAQGRGGRRVKAAPLLKLPGVLKWCDGSRFRLAGGLSSWKNVGEVD